MWRSYFRCSYIYLAQHGVFERSLGEKAHLCERGGIGRIHVSASSFKFSRGPTAMMQSEEEKQALVHALGSVL